MAGALDEITRRLAAAESVFGETRDPDLADAAYMDVLALRMQLRAEIRRARIKAGIETAGLRELAAAAAGGGGGGE